MKVVVVGNGLAGTIFAKTLREMDRDVVIDVFSDENYYYYPRPNLIELLAGNLDYERLFAFKREWYETQDISLHLETPVRKIHPESGKVELEGGREELFDFLFLANGSYAFIPPFKERDKPGVFTLRTLDDALAIQDYLTTHELVTLIGGGLLGLEIARALKSGGADVQVVEFFPRLLPRQLDTQGAELLKAQIEDLGIRVYLSKTTEEILGGDRISGLRFKDGKELKTEAAVVAAGVRPEIRLAKEAGLETDKGIIVNDHLQTSCPTIYTAGDNVQHRNRLYGIIPASFAQARIAAANVLNDSRSYEGTIASNTLKIVGLYVTSIGHINPEEDGYLEIRKEDRESRIYKKVVVKENRMVGAIWMGTKEGVVDINRIISQGSDVSRWKDSLLDDGFDLSVV